ncbi:MAG: hypothetical protein Q4P71_01455 [Actinomycetaceae bacterium]|nr:hypothetical protein [Actinomycetaceae bacterium]
MSTHSTSINLSDFAPRFGLWVITIALFFVALSITAVGLSVGNTTLIAVGSIFAGVVAVNAFVEAVREALHR